MLYHVFLKYAVGSDFEKDISTFLGLCNTLKENKTDSGIQPNNVSNFKASFQCFFVNPLGSYHILEMHLERG